MSKVTNNEVPNNSEEENLLTIVRHNNKVVVDSREIAKELGNDHASVIRLLDNHKELIEMQFGRVGFEIVPFKTAGGIQKGRIAYLTEEQAILIGTLSKNTSEAVLFKAKLVKSFLVARKLIFDEEKDPELAVKRAVRSWERQGQTPEWINERIKGIGQRTDFTLTLQEHGVASFGFANCTNAIYKPIFGTGAKGIKLQRNLPEKSNVRDHMSSAELSHLGLAEMLAAENIERKDLKGNGQCEKECSSVSTELATVIAKIRRS